MDEPTDLRDVAGKKLLPRVMAVPQPIKRTSGIAANFLWDKASYVLGVSAKGGELIARAHEAFVQLHRDVLDDCEDPGLQALLAFLKSWRLEAFERWSHHASVLNANLVFRLDGEQREIDLDTAGKVGHTLQQMAEGRLIKEAAPEVDPTTRFYVLGLAPNASRISIRFWYVDSLDGLYRRFAEHFDDLSIEPSPFRKPPSIWRLLIQTATGGKSENIPKQLAGEVMRAVLTGQAYPRTLLSTTIMRLRSDRSDRSDRDAMGVRVAIIKACLARQARKIPEKEASL